MPQPQPAVSSGKPQGTRGTDAEAIAEAAVAELHDLGAAPDTVREIVRITSDESATIEQLRAAVCREPSLAVRVLKVVNSALYGLRGHLDSIQRAITLLGFEAVRQIAIATTVLPLFRRNQLHPAFDLRELGQHSIGVAAAGSMIARRTGLAEAEPAFLAGLVHDVGLLVEIRTRQQVFIRCLRDFHDEGEHRPELTFREVERVHLGADHEHFGAALCRHWRFPDNILQAVRHHHQPDPAAVSLAGIVHLADILAARAELGYTGTVKTTELPHGIISAIGLEPADIEQIEHDLPGTTEEIEQLFD